MQPVCALGAGAVMHAPANAAAWPGALYEIRDTLSDWLAAPSVLLHCLRWRGGNKVLSGWVP